MTFTRASVVACLLSIPSACHAASASPSGPSPSPTTASEAPSKAPAAPQVGTDPGHVSSGGPLAPSGHDKLAAFAGGCFWGVEDAFRHVPGVVATAVGYAGGHVPKPTYEEVCTHTTGHAETVLIEYDPTHLPYEQLLRVFWKIHDPTQGDRQGPDVGDSYRSVVFTFDAEQAAAARASEQAEQKSLDRPITTEIRPIGAFYEAEGYHQQYAERTGHHGCPIRVPVDTL
jgi:peptide-methionine (S)-S-oxide reductase